MPDGETGEGGKLKKVYSDVQGTHFKATSGQMTMLRITQRQSQRGNYSTADPQTYYRVSICVPLSDDVLSQLESRFESHTKK